MNAQDLKKEFDENVNAFTGGTVHQGTVVGVLKKACRSDSDYRLVLKVLTGHTSSKELSPDQWYGLFCFVQPIKPEGGKWGSQHGDLELAKMCNSLVLSAVDQPGQEKMPF